MRLEDYDLPESFSSMLAAAERYAEGEWERRLVSDLSEKYDEYDDQMFLSKKQYLHFRLIYNKSLHST